MADQETKTPGPETKMTYKTPGTRATHYRGGPYAGLTEVDGKQTHSAEAAANREDPVSHEPVSKRFGHLAVGNRAGGGMPQKDGGAEAREYDGYTKHSQVTDYAKKHNITTPDRWEQMSVEDKKGWLDENT